MTEISVLSMQSGHHKVNVVSVSVQNPKRTLHKWSIKHAHVDLHLKINQNNLHTKILASKRFHTFFSFSGELSSFNSASLNYRMPKYRLELVIIRNEMYVSGEKGKN